MVDKNSIKENITISQMYQLLEQLGASPKMQGNIITCQTICHNGNSHKLYYYNNSKTFFCYTSCGSFDIFELISKIYGYDFISSIYYIISYFELGEIQNKKNDNSLIVFKNYEQLKKKKDKVKKTVETSIVLPDVDMAILDRFLYPKIQIWKQEGIDYQVMKDNFIGYYPGDSQITIPHFDIQGRLIGIRGRQICFSEAEKYGKYRPLFINGQLFNHPLALNLYHLNKTIQNISKNKVAIIFEGEKSCLKYCSYFGEENDISVACCGSSISEYQINLLLEAGAREIIIAFDRQFQSIGDNEFHRLTKKITNLYRKYSNIVNMSFIFDKNMITDYKDAPIDKGKDIFLQLYKERIKEI